MVPIAADEATKPKPARTKPVYEFQGRLYYFPWPLLNTGRQLT